MRGLILILTILFKILIHLIFVLQECQAPGHATTANAYQPTRVSAYLTIKHLRGLTVLPFQVQRLPVTSLPPSADPSPRRNLPTGTSLHDIPDVLRYSQNGYHRVQGILASILTLKG